jgi:ABC-type lipoprotein release transport system permease subunit
MLLRIAFRNIFRQKRRSILTALTMFGGFTLAAFSIGWSDGTYSYVIDAFTRNRLGHIQIHGHGYLEKASLYNTIQDHEDIGGQLNELSGVQTWTPRLYSAGLASVGDNSAGAQIIGMDPAREAEATRFDKRIVAGRNLPTAPAPEALLGKGLATILAAQPGDSLVILSQAADGSIANDLYEIVGLVETGDEIGDRTAIYLHLLDAQELLVLEGRVHEIVVIADDLDDVEELAQTIEAKLANPDLEVAPWQEFAKAFYQAMKLDQQGTWISLFIILMIVAVGVLNTVLMSVLERTREYGVLRAIGTRPGQIFTLVICEVAIMTIFSIIIGAMLGTLVNHLLSIEGIAMPQAFSYGGIEFDRMYTEVNARSLYIPAITVLLSAIFVSAFPSIKAARIEPARAMRTH